jgi:hypothetical protein
VKQIILCRIFLMVALIGFTGCQSMPTTMALEQHIIKHARQTKGQELPQFRSYAHGDLDGDGKQDTAVIYTLEGVRGGIDWLRFLAVSLSSENGRIIFQQVGVKDIRAVGNIEIVNGKIVASILEYAPSDASCCPSISKTANFVIKHRKLIEVGK